MQVGYDGGENTDVRRGNGVNDVSGKRNFGLATSPVGVLYLISIPSSRREMVNCNTHVPQFPYQ